VDKHELNEMTLTGVLSPVSGGFLLPDISASLPKESARVRASLCQKSGAKIACQVIAKVRT
jgi:hypothetical protein